MTQDRISPTRGVLATRRGLIGGLVGGLGAAAGVSSLHAAPAPSTWSLRALPRTYTFALGDTLTYSRLEHIAGGSLIGSLPLLEATEGQSVQLDIDNQLTGPLRLEVIGVALGPALRGGQSGSFTFTMPPAGTYLVTEARRGIASAGGLGAAVATHPSRGIAAVLISRPSSGLNELWNGGPAFDRETVLLYEDTDDRWNAVLADPTLPPPQAPYEPNFFTVNGLAYPDLPADPTCVPAGQVGERILIRLANLGRMRQSIHFHGFHVDVAARNNQPEAILGQKDTVGLPSRGTVDVILTANQVGVYPLHPHSLTAVTANGYYPFGQLTVINIT